MKYNNLLYQELTQHNVVTAYLDQAINAFNTKYSYHSHTDLPNDMIALRNFIDRLSNPAFLLDESGQSILHSNLAANNELGYESMKKLKVSEYIRFLPEDIHDQLLAQFNNKWYEVSNDHFNVEGNKLQLLNLNTIYGQPDAITLENWKNMIAVMLHRFRSPLTGIDGYIDLLEEENKDETLSKRFSSIQKGFRHIFDMMDELEILYNTNGNFEPAEFEEINLFNVLFASILNFKKEDQNRFKVDEETISKVSINTNPAHLKSLLMLLLSNGLDHSDGDIHLQADPANSGKIRIVNKNPGIPKEIKSRIFHPFITTRADQLGIGLTMALLYARKIGALILFNENKKEVSFTLQFPINQ